MNRDNPIWKNREQIFAIARAHGARNIRVFGSVSQGEERAGSDVDFLVEMAAGRSLIDRVALSQDLEALLGQKVDVVTDQGLHWYIRDKVLREALPL